VALFSFFGKKNRPPDHPDDANDVPASEPGQDIVSVQIEDPAEREVIHQRKYRDIARMTAEKIDAIESEIARDILKVPSAAPTLPETVEETVIQGEVEDAENDQPANSIFHITLIRMDKETRILFKEDMDE